MANKKTIQSYKCPWCGIVLTKECESPAHVIQRYGIINYTKCVCGEHIEIEQEAITIHTQNHS